MKINLAVCTFSGITKRFDQQLREISKALEILGHNVFISIQEKSPYIQISRNRLIDNFYENDYDKIVFIDDDVYLSKLDATKLVTIDEDVIYGLYRSKIEKHHYTVKLLSNEILNDLAKIHSAPAGLVCIKREVIEKLKRTFPENYYYVSSGDKHSNFFAQGVYSIEDKQVWIGEDFAFCLLCRQANIKMYAHTNLYVEHFDRINGKSYIGNFKDFHLKHNLLISNERKER